MKALAMLRRLLWGGVAVVCIAVVGIVIWRWQARALSEAKSQLPLEGLKNTWQGTEPHVSSLNFSAAIRLFLPGEFRPLRFSVSVWY